MNVLSRMHFARCLARVRCQSNVALAQFLQPLDFIEGFNEGSGGDILSRTHVARWSARVQCQSSLAAPRA